MKKLNIFLLIILFPLSKVGFSQDLMVGNIELKWLSGYTYEISADLYTKSDSNLNRCEIIIDFGDGIIDTIQRFNGPPCPDSSCSACGEYIGNGIYVNFYAVQHTYPGPGIYAISYLDSFRIDSIQNIPNSIDEALYLEYNLMIDPSFGFNNSPVFSTPFDIAYISNIYIYNPGAYDIDGDSLSYSLIPPFATNSFIPNNMTIDSITGDITWDVPQTFGKYVIALITEEWRGGNKIGSVIREMLIYVDTTLTSIENLKYRNKEILVFPNPASTKIFINSNFDTPALFELYDITGRKVLEQTITGINSQININHLSNGFYIYKFATEKTGSFTGKIIKQY